MAINDYLMGGLNENVANIKYQAYYYYKDTTNNTQDRELLMNYSQLAN